MIKLHSANGIAFAINHDLIERVEEAGDTHVTLIGGERYTVSETLDEIVASIRHEKAVVRAVADTMLLSGDVATAAGVDSPGPRSLRTVPTEGESER
ncbi:MAG TPA: flagellar FlbD family protein [Acidimicrobiales bacterium]|jgi:flagellar protein FlbD|nr:flagellar FlbD family protein [Acidimicrobiales bacterium]